MFWIDGMDGSGELAFCAYFIGNRQKIGLTGKIAAI